MTADEKVKVGKLLEYLEPYKEVPVGGLSEAQGIVTTMREGLEELLPEEEDADD